MASWPQTRGDSPQGTVPGAPTGAATTWWDQRRNPTKRPQDNRKQHRMTVPMPRVVRCNVPSTVEMPAKAQKMWGGRKVYVCGLPRDHTGPHRWPADPIILIAEWS